MKGERDLGAKCAHVRRGTRPGMHGKARVRNVSEFGAQLREKQKVRYSYGVTDTALRRVFAEASKMPGRTNEALLSLLERRLDNMVFRSGFAVSRGIARHIVSHGHVLVNGKRVNVPSYRVRAGDEIRLRPRSLESPMFSDLSNRLKKHEPPAWIELDREGMSAKVKALPGMAEVRDARDLSMVVEYYSK